MGEPELSLIVPIYNEEEVIDIFLETIEIYLKPSGIAYEVVFVNDGSVDNSIEILKRHAQKNPKIRIISLSRNFGKEQALTAGIDHVTGHAVIPLDCDLQDPPEIIVAMYSKWREGYDVVLAKRVDRQSDSFVKRSSSSLFYKLIDKISDIKIPENVGDFRLMDRKVINALKQYPERSRFMKGIFASVGFNECVIEYTRQKEQREPQVGIISSFGN